MAKSVSNLNVFSDDSGDSRNLVDRVFSALWLISLGTVFLLNSVGVLPWSIWISVIIILAKWWPLFLIGAGISVILEGSKAGKIISGIIWCIGFLVLFAFAIKANPDLNIDVNSEDFPESIIEEVVDQVNN